MEKKLSTKLTYDEFDKLLQDEIIPEVLRIREAGQKEYARELSNVFSNFERVADFAGVTVDQAILTYLIKHIDGIAAHVDGLESQREDVTGRVIDAIVYLCLLYGRFHNNTKEQNVPTVQSSIH